MGRRGFIPRHHPKAGLRKAREDARYADFYREQAVLRGEQAAREREDDRRLRMMARLEPGRYMRLVGSGQVHPRYRDAALAELRRAAAPPPRPGGASSRRA
jgi:hypothetical protein